MSKKFNLQSLSERTKQNILIGVIIALAAILLTIALIVILNPTVIPPVQENDQTPAEQESTLTIKNGDFSILVNPTAGTFPKTPKNWKGYAFGSYDANKKQTTLSEVVPGTSLLMGAVDISDWEKVQSQTGLTTLVNPGLFGDEEENEAIDKNIYMISSPEATNAGILSDTFSIAASSSAKITLSINTAYLTSGNASIVIHTSSSSTSNTTPTQSQRLIGVYDIAKSDASVDGGWVEQSFYITNEKTSSQRVQISVSLGNIYDENKDDATTLAAGTLFVDDIKFDSSISANEIRIAPKTHSATVKATSSDNNAEDLPLVAEGSTVVEDLTKETYLNEASAKIGDVSYSPFMADEEGAEKTIYKVATADQTSQQIGLRLVDATKLTVAEGEDKDHLHISFWLRLHENNAVTFANIYLQEKGDDGEWADLDAGSFLKQETSQEIDTGNCGWTKYDIYLKPGENAKEVSVLITLGNKDGNSNAYNPDGILYVMIPSVEVISQSDYASASSSSVSKKVNLIGIEATTTVTNGSFSDYSKENLQPTNWTSAFAGSISIYKDGKGTETIEGVKTTAGAIAGSGIVKNNDVGRIDDEIANVLCVKNTEATSHGYISKTISLGANSVNVISVMAKVEDGGVPYIYVINNDKETRADAIVAKVESTYTADNNVKNDVFGQFDQSADNGWVRYYIVVVTSQAQTVRLALFNGSIDGSVKGAAGSAVYYDGVDVTKVGSFTISAGENEERKDIVYTAVSGYEGISLDKVSGALSIKDSDENAITVASIQPTADDWNDLTKVDPQVEEDHDHDHNHEENENTVKGEVDLALLFSALASILLVAILGVVVVIKIFRNRKKA